MRVGKAGAVLSTARTTTARRALCAAAAALLVVIIHAASAQAVVATGGQGRFVGAIDWVTWGANGATLSIPATRQSITNYPDGSQLVVSCTISNADGHLAAYRPGSFSGDALDDMYNIGGTGGSNTLVNGIAGDNAATDQFDFGCSATLNGQPFALRGIVFADAEQSGPTEFTQGEITPGATWRLIDRFRDCSNVDSTVTHTVGATDLLRLNGSTDCGTGPAGVAFADGATSGHITMHGSGRSAIALGAVVGVDHGDAPASYGDAANVEQYGFAGGEPAIGTTALFAGTALATTTQPALLLGTSVDPEAGTPSAGADSDDLTGSGVFGPSDDETNPPTTPVGDVAGASYSQTVVCQGTGSVAGWIDFNGNGEFDANEASAIVPCLAGSATVSWTVPAGATAPQSSFERLRIASNVAELTPTGLAHDGETEDYPIQIVNTPPTATVTGPVDGGDYFVGQNVPASYSCADADGTVTSCVGTVAVGSPIDTSSPGTKSFTVTATDNDNAVTTKTVTYHVHAVAGVCRGSSLRLPLGLIFGTANEPLAPCVTASKTDVNVNQISGNPGSLLGSLVNSLTSLQVGASALIGTSTQGGNFAAATSDIANANLKVGPVTITVNGVHSDARSQLTSCSSAALTGSSRIAKLTINGAPINVLDNQPITIPLVVGTLYINQTAVQGNTVTKRAFFLDLPGTALDVVLGESIAGASCA